MTSYGMSQQAPSWVEVKPAGVHDELFIPAGFEPTSCCARDMLYGLLLIGRIQ